MTDLPPPGMRAAIDRAAMDEFDRQHKGGVKYLSGFNIDGLTDAILKSILAAGASGCAITVCTCRPAECQFPAATPAAGTTSDDERIVRLLRQIATEFAIDNKTDCKQHICWIAADRLMLKPKSGYDDQREQIAKIICCGPGKCTLEGTERGCLALDPEHGEQAKADAILALSSSHSPAANAWQPIETAPKDRRILAIGGGLREVEVVSYNERIGCWSAETCTLDDRDDEAEGYSRPRYWMPLPDTSSLPSTTRGGAAQ